MSSHLKINPIRFESDPADKDMSKVSPQIKLLFLAVLMSVLWFSFAHLITDNTDLTDETTRTRVTELRELSSDAEPSLSFDDTFSTHFSNIQIVCALLFVICATRFIKITPRLTFLYHIRPRSPPL